MMVYESMQFPSVSFDVRGREAKGCVGPHPKSSETVRRQVRIKCLANVCVATTLVVSKISIDTQMYFTNLHFIRTSL